MAYVTNVVMASSFFYLRLVERYEEPTTSKIELKTANRA